MKNANEQLKLTLIYEKFNRLTSHHSYGILLRYGRSMRQPRSMHCFLKKIVFCVLIYRFQHIECKKCLCLCTQRICSSLLRTETGQTSLFPLNEYSRFVIVWIKHAFISLFNGGWWKWMRLLLTIFRIFLFNLYLGFIIFTQV